MMPVGRGQSPFGRAFALGRALEAAGFAVEWRFSCDREPWHQGDWIGRVARMRRSLVEHSTAEWLLMLDTDIDVRAEEVAAAVEWLRAHPDHLGTALWPGSDGGRARALHWGPHCMCVLLRGEARGYAESFTWRVEGQCECEAFVECVRREGWLLEWHPSLRSRPLGGV